MAAALRRRHGCGVRQGSQEAHRAEQKDLVAQLAGVLEQIEERTRTVRRTLLDSGRGKTSD